MSNVNSDSDSPTGEAVFAPSCSSFVKLLMVAAVPAGVLVYEYGMSVLPFVGGGFIVYALVLAAVFPRLRITNTTCIISSMLRLTRAKVVEWPSVRQLDVLRLTENSSPFLIQMQLESGKTVTVIGPLVRNPDMFLRAILDRLPEEAEVVDETRFGSHS